MNQEIFKANVFMAAILPAIVTVGLLVIYFVVGVPFWFLLFLVIPILMVVSGQKEKLIIEDDRLRYEKIFGGEEVSLKNVSKILTRQVETIVERSPGTFNNSQKQGLSLNFQPVNQERQVERVVYVLDESGRTFFSFPANLIGMNNRRRFEDAVMAVNSKIEVR